MSVKKTIHVSLDYAYVFNYYWFGAIRVNGIGNPGIWKWVDGSNVTIE